MQWRILKLSPLCNEHSSETLPKIRVVRSRCNSKACQYCQLRYYRQIRSKVRLASINTSWRMFTLTGLHTPNNEAEDCILLEKHFRELRKKLKRKYPEFLYFAVKELSPNGMWHYHGLWNIYIDIKELSKMWQEISGAYRVWLQKIERPRSAINYIFKYCFKSLTNPRELRTLYECDKRKFSSSKGLLVNNQNKNPYTSEYGITYSRDDLIQELYNIICSSELSVDSFASVDYPYFEDMIFNLYDKWNEEHPPNLFDSPRLASLGSGILISP